MAETGWERKMLHFYPGPRRLLFIVDSKLVLDVDARGGPRYPGGKPTTANEMQQMPTTPGRYRVGWVGRYVTRTWDQARIPWGARLKPHPSDDKDMLYEASPGHWRSVLKVAKVTRRQLEDGNKHDYHDEHLPTRWLWNPFGPVAIRYYVDRNDNHRRDPGEPLSGEMFHTTPDDEANADRPLDDSHGCIHIKPLDRDALLKAGAFLLGTLLVIHDYGEVAPVPRADRGN